MPPLPTSVLSPYLPQPEVPCPPLAGDLRTDVVIVGGGFTGLYTALALREVGVEVAVLEQRFAGSGASGRSAGFVDGLIGKDYPSLLKLFSVARAREFCAFSKEAVLQLERFIEAHQIPCEYVPNGNVLTAVHPRQFKRLQTLVEAGDALGLELEHLGAEAMRERGLPPAFLAGVFDPVGGVLNPGRLAHHVRALALEGGVRLFEHTPVRRVENSKPVVVRTEGGNVVADHAVLATNAYTAQLGWKKRLLSPVWCGLVETEPLTAEQEAQLGWAGHEGIYTAHEKLESYRRTARNTLIAGGKHIKIPYGFRLNELSAPDIADALTPVFRRRLGHVPDLEFAAFWGGWIGISLDFMPSWGVTGAHENIHYGIGYAGHGIPQTLMVGRILAAQVQGQTHPLAHVLDRRQLPIPPEPFKWLASHAVDVALGAMDARTDRGVLKMKA